jgi:hypothetical protein
LGEEFIADGDATTGVGTKAAGRGPVFERDVVQRVTPSSPAHHAPPPKATAPGETPDGEAKTDLISNRLNILMLTWFKEC